MEQPPYLHDIETGAIVSATSDRSEHQGWHDGDQVKAQLFAELPRLLLSNSLQPKVGISKQRRLTVLETVQYIKYGCITCVAA